MIASPIIRPVLHNSIVTNWVKRVQANGGATPSNSTQAALIQFYNGLITDGLLSKMIAVNCYVPDNLIASITPLIKTVGNDPWTNNGPFVSGDLTINGLTGNASNKYLDTGCQPSTALNQTNAGLSIYGSVVGSSPFVIGSETPGSNNPDLILSPNVWDCWNNSSERVLHLTGLAGFYSGNRVASNDSRVYFANSTHTFAQVGSTVTAGSSSPNSNTLWVMADDGGGGVTFPSNGTISFSAIHNGLSSTDSSNLFNRVQTMRQSLGGGYV